MPKHVKSNTKQEFLDYMRKNRINDDIITKFIDVPNFVTYNGNEFKLQIIRTFVNVSATEYNFEMNYYSEHLVEYFLNPKVFADIETSVNFLLCELTKKNILK